MNYKKIIIPSIVAIFAISAWALIPVTMLETHSYTTDIPVSQLFEDSDLVIVGSYSHERTEETWIDTMPLRNVVTVNVLEVLKGDYRDRTLEIIDEGDGVSFQNGYRMDVSLGDAKMKYKSNQKMIMFFEHSVDDGKGNVNALGEGYYLMGRSLGVFNIDGNHAVHDIEDRSMTIKDIRAKLLQR